MPACGGCELRVPPRGFAQAAFLTLVLFACAAASGPQRRVEAVVHDRLAGLAAADPAVEYRVGPIRVDRAGEELYRARFELDRRFLDEAAMPHIARREQTWLVRARSSGAVEIVEIEEQQVLAFPGTGPRVVCY